MEIDEFINLVADEPERKVTRTVWTTPAEVLAKAAASGLRLTDLLSAPGRHAEQRDFRYRHVLGSPASRAAIATWQTKHPLQVLPADLRALVERIDGIHLWADVATGRSYTGLAPIEEWDVAASRCTARLRTRVFSTTGTWRSRTSKMGPLLWSSTSNQGDIT